MEMALFLGLLIVGRARHDSQLWFVGLKGRVHHWLAAMGLVIVCVVRHCVWVVGQKRPGGVDNQNCGTLGSIKKPTGCLVRSAWLGLWYAPSVG